MTALKTCTVNFNDLYLKSNIGKVSHYRPGILFDHLICLNISFRNKVSHSAERISDRIGERYSSTWERFSEILSTYIPVWKPVTAGHNLKNPISLSVIYLLV